jgi:general nucleoside transport system ATP-binding protein
VARAGGAGVLLVWVERYEIRALSDRIAVMYRGQIAGEILGSKATEEVLGLLMAGGNVPTHEGTP